ncbi:hypothetical protein ADL30_22320 [Streptomyces sp. NRRL S-1521]|nr:hypothetical protein ADL30_22320 [Streptomyces sp. NRRL S-1521]
MYDCQNGEVSRGRLTPTRPSPPPPPLDAASFVLPHAASARDARATAAAARTARGIRVLMGLSHTVLPAI